MFLTLLSYFYIFFTFNFVFDDVLKTLYILGIYEVMFLIFLKIQTKFSQFFS